MVSIEAKRSEVAEYIHQLQSILKQAKNDFETDPELFYQANIFKMGKFIPTYSELMKFLQVVVSDDVFRELKEIDSDLAESHLASSLDKFMLSWNIFLQSVEPKVIMFKVERN